MEEHNASQEGATGADRGKKGGVTAICIVKPDTKFEEILEWDRKGYRIAWEYENGAFRTLKDEEKEQLSVFAKTVYSAMLELYKKYDPKRNEEARSVVVGHTPSPYGGPLERFRGIKVKEGLSHFTVRPDELDGALSNGWRVARDEDVVGGIGKRDGHFEIPTLSTGMTEQILVVKDRDAQQQKLYDDAAGTIAIGEQRAESIREQINETGYKAVDA